MKPGVHVCPGCHMSPGEVTSVPRLDWARVSAINGPEMIWKVWAVIHAGAAACKHGGSWNAESEIELNIWHSSSSSAPWPGTHYQAPTQPGHGGIWPYYAWSLQLLHTTLHSNHHSKILKKGLTGQVVILNDCPQEEGISPRGAGKGSDWGATEWAWPGGGAEYFISSYLLLISPHLHIIQLSRTFF